MKESLWESKPEIEGQWRSRNSAVDGGRVNSGMESEPSDARRAVGDVGGDEARDRRAVVVAKAKGDKIVNQEESGASGTAATDSFKSSIVRTARDVLEGSD